LIGELSFSALAKTLPARHSGGEILFSKLSTDSRKIQAGSAFLALKGNKFDGHTYVEPAIRAGASGAIVSRPCTDTIPQLIVGNTHDALRDIARLNRDRSEAQTIALTGSQAKTTVKELIAGILSSKAPTLATEANFNNTIGVPLTLLRLNEDHRYAVVEMGADRPGEIGFSAQAACPDIALITMASAAHVEGFGSLAGIVKGKGEILDHIRPGGIAVLNHDDPNVEAWIGRLEGRRSVQFSVQQSACSEYRARDIESLADGHVSFNLVTPFGELDIAMRLLGRHNVMNAVAAAAVALEAGADLGHVKQGLESALPVRGRLCAREGLRGAVILDDSYNASPNSFRAAIDVLATFSGQKILIVGDMKELGTETSRAHQAVGAMAKHAEIQSLWAVGDYASVVAKNFGEGAIVFEDQHSLIRYASTRLESDSVALIKGSRGAKMERVVRELCRGEHDLC